MSRPHALAAVTQVLLDLVDANLRDNDVSSLVNGSGPTTALPPDRVLDASGALEQPRLNLFLHGITYNPAYRNADLPTRDPRGQPVSNPVLGLDLHYLLTAYGQDDFQAETLMGFGMEALHRNPMPSRQRIVRALTPPEWQSGRGLNLATLEITELAQQIESIKITPKTLSVDDMSKLWTALQTHLRLTSLYAVSVVLIESQVPKRTPLPVLTRGPRVPRRVIETFPQDHLPENEREQEQGIVVQPGLVPPVPTLEKATYDNNQVAVRMEETIILEGHHLDGVDVRFTEVRSRKTLDVRPTEVSSTRLVVSIPGPSANPEAPADADPSIANNWQAGFYSVAALTSAAVEGERERVSNELPVVMAPRIDGEVGVSTFQSPEGETVFVFTVTCSPPMRNTQKASLIVGQREIHAEPLEAEQSATLTFRDTEFERETEHWVRLIVDGSSSIFIDRNQEPPVFTGPAVDIP